MEALIHIDLETRDRLQWQADQLGQPLETYITTVLVDHAAGRKTTGNHGLAVEGCRVGLDEVMFNSPIDLEPNIAFQSALERLLQIVSRLPSTD